MKVCFVSAYPPSRGNLAEYAYFLTKELIRDARISSLTILANGDFLKRERKRKLKIIRCWKNDSLLIPLKILINVYRENPDVVHFNIHMRSWGRKKLVNFFAHLTPFLVKFFLRKKVVVTLHNILESVNLKEMGISNDFLTLLGAKISTKFLLFSDRLVVLLKRYKRIIRNRYKKNVVYIPHGTLGKKISNINFNGYKILTFGFWSPYKNLPLLIEVFNELKKKFKKIELIVAGGPHPNYPTYLTTIKEKYKLMKGIKFLGYIPNRKLSSLFSSSSLIVLPYLVSTGTSGVVHLAVSYGKPIIVSKLPDIEATVREEGYKIIFVRKNDKVALRKAIERLLKNKKLYLRIAERNLELSEKYSFSKISKMYVNLYRKLIPTNNK
ncbi:MAG: glycosyltransferase [Candidatus Aenigmarchaeota archaeon]|nr:glycosyltransferase [Candidatus Aenigmarchaeota archaeon]